MLILKIIGLSLGSILILFIVKRLDGNREISQLTMFDYIIGITRRFLSKIFITQKTYF